jgi:hypothetical protein
VLTSDGTGETYVVSADRSPAAADVPAGDYRAVLRAGNGAVLAVRHVTVDGVRAVNGRDLAASVAHPEEFGGSYAAGATVHLWVGVRNRTGGGVVAGETVTVSLRRPDGVVETRTATTDDLGTATVAYDTAGKPEGRYEVEDVTVGGARLDAFGDFIVGDYARVRPGFDAAAEPGREATLAVRVTEGGRPVADSRTELRVVGPDGQPAATSEVRTDDAGVATVSFTPTQTGQYRVRADGVGRPSSSLRVGDGIASLLVQGEAFGDGTAGEPVTISGQVIRDGAPLSNADLTVTVSNETDFDDAVSLAFQV